MESEVKFPNNKCPNCEKRVWRMATECPHCHGKEMKYMFYVASRDDQRGHPKASGRACDSIVWWKPNRLGYTTNIDEAGIYNEPDEFPDDEYIKVPVTRVRDFAIKTVPVELLESIDKEK